MNQSNNLPRRSVSVLLTVLIITIVCAASVFAQTTAFTYQGRFTDSSVQQPTNGSYTMTFRLFDAASGGSQVSGTSDVTSMVSVVNNIFTTRLDFGAAAFNTTSARYLEIQIGSTVLTPRQEITSTPFSQRALTAANAERLGGVLANQFVQTNDSRLTDSRTPTAGSTNYIQNTTTQQSANFNVSGNGTVGGTLSSTKVSVTGGVLARGGAPGGFGANNNGYAFSGNGGDTDSGLFSEANGRVSLFSDSVERLRVEGGTTTVTGSISVSGTISGTLADNTVGTAQVADGSLRIGDFAITNSTAALPAFALAPHTCTTFGLNGSGGAVGDLLTVYLSNDTPAGFYIQPSFFTTANTANVSICNTLNTANNFPAQSPRVVVTRP